MNSNEIVETLRQRINKLHPTETFQDAFIWREFTMARSRVLKNQLSRRNKLSRLNYHSVCIELIDVDESECACVATGCKVKRTKHQIPSFLHTSSNSTLMIKNIKNQPIPQSQEECIEDDIKYKPGYKNKQVSAIRNGYAYVYNSSAKHLVLDAIWANPLELLFIQKCEQDKCLQDNKDLIQISEELLLDMFNIVMSSLSPSLQIPLNDTNDGSDKV
jgi:hypothetical protein